VSIHLTARGTLGLANCYFSSHRECNIVTSCRRLSPGLHWWSLILEVFATDSIFERDSISAGVFEFCMTFCWSMVDSRVRPWTTVYRAQTSYGLSRLFLACFGGVTGQRPSLKSLQVREAR